MDAGTGYEYNPEGFLNDHTDSVETAAIRSQTSTQWFLKWDIFINPLCFFFYIHVFMFEIEENSVVMLYSVK